MENTENDLALKDLNDLKFNNKKMKSLISISNQLFIFQMFLIIIVLAFAYFDNYFVPNFV
jgi:hypothetical protein